MCVPVCVCVYAHTCMYDMSPGIPWQISLNHYSLRIRYMLQCVFQVTNFSAIPVYQNFPQILNVGPTFPPLLTGVASPLLTKQLSDFWASLAFLSAHCECQMMRY